MLKLLSEDPANYKDAPREGIRRVLEEVTGQPHPRDVPLDTSRIISIRMGTTVRIIVPAAIQTKDMHAPCKNCISGSTTNVGTIFGVEGGGMAASNLRLHIWVKEHPLFFLVQVATNALLERKGEPCCLVTTKGFRDLLHIGNQSRPAIFDLEIDVPDVLYSQVLEIDEQVCCPWRAFSYNA